MSDPIEFQLATPIEDLDLNKITSVTIRPPTGRHLMKAGPIYRLANDGDAVDIIPDAVGKLIGQCCKLPNRSVEMLSAADFMGIQTILLPFLAPTMPSTPSLTPPVSGTTSTSSSG